MSPTTSTVYLISGANRGLGLGLAQSLIQRPNTIVFAGVRDIASSKVLNDLAKQHENLHVLTLSSAGKEDNEAAAKEIERVAGKLDVLIANAGIANAWDKAVDSSPDQLLDHYKVNVLGPLILFQSVYPLLKKSPKPLFTFISTGAASLTDMPNLPLQTATYGSSKISMTFITRRIHYEEPELIAFGLAPGWVQTDMGNAGAKSVGMEEAPLTVQQSVDGMLNVIDNATRETWGGKTANYDGTEIPW